MDHADEMNQRKPREAKLEDIVKEVGNGILQVTIANSRIVGVPKQRIEAPSKHGIRREFSVDEPIWLIA
jgi:predicted regulator of amino acid metabolism with ACT domain